MPSTRRNYALRLTDRRSNRAGCDERKGAKAERDAAARGLYRPSDPEWLAQKQMGEPVQALARWRPQSRDCDVTPLAAATARLASIAARTSRQGPRLLVRTGCMSRRRAARAG